MVKRLFDKKFIMRTLCTSSEPSFLMHKVILMISLMCFPHLNIYLERSK
jgi:hypothetical protein